MKLLILLLTTIILFTYIQFIYKSLRIRERIIDSGKYKELDDTISFTCLEMNQSYIKISFLTMFCAFLGFLYVLNFRTNFSQDSLIIIGVIVMIISVIILLFNLDDPVSVGHYIGIGVFFLVLPFFLARISYHIYSENVLFGLLGYITITLSVLFAIVLEVVLKVVREDRPDMLGYHSQLIYLATPMLWLIINTVYLVMYNN